MSKSIKIKLPKERNYTVRLVVTKTGAGKHKDKKKEQKNKHEVYFHEK
jgi:hypothetical protein